ILQLVRQDGEGDVAVGEEEGSPGRVLMDELHIEHLGVVLGHLLGIARENGQVTDLRLCHDRPRICWRFEPPLSRSPGPAASYKRASPETNCHGAAGLRRSNPYVKNPPLSRRWHQKGPRPRRSDGKPRHFRHFRRSRHFVAEQTRALSTWHPKPQASAASASATQRHFMIWRTSRNPSTRWLPISARCAA